MYTHHDRSPQSTGDSKAAANESGSRATRQMKAVRQLVDTPAPENLTGMPDGLKTGMESLSGIDLSDVRVHFDSAQPAAMNALAFAQGDQVHIGPGQEQHLPHEIAHVVQQREGLVQPTMQLQDGTPLNTDPGLEHEADLLGAAAKGA